MKLLYFVIQMDQVGGVARMESEKINWLARHGYEVVVCDIESWEMTPYYPLDSSVKFFTGQISTKPGSFLLRLTETLLAVRRVVRILREEQPDVVINAHCPLVTWILPFVKYGVGQKSSTGRRRVPKLIAEMHQSRQGLAVFARQYMGPISRWLHGWTTRWIYSRYDHFVCLTHEDAAAWHLPNAVTIPNFSNLSTDETALPEHHQQILLLARLVPQKRIDLMMQVWAGLHREFPHWQVKVIGDGIEREGLQRLAEALGISQSFLMPGAVRDVLSELNHSQILCLTSEYEGFGLVLIEAMQTGVPVIAFEYSGLRDIVSHEEDGLIVPFGDVEEYRKQLRRLMTSPQERERLARNARQSVRQFSPERVMQQWVTLFENC